MWKKRFLYDGRYDWYKIIDDIIFKIKTTIDEVLITLPLHPDFTERNMLFKNNEVVLICD